MQLTIDPETESLKLEKGGLYKLINGNIEVEVDGVSLFSNDDIEPISVVRLSPLMMTIFNRANEDTDMTILMNQYIQKEVKVVTEEEEWFDNHLRMRKYRQYFLSNLLTQYKKLNLDPTENFVGPIAPGVFTGDYGSHGGEFIQLVAGFGGLSDTRGVKLTGDPNIPFDKEPNITI